MLRRVRQLLLIAAVAAAGCSNGSSSSSPTVIRLVDAFKPEMVEGSAARAAVLTPTEWRFTDGTAGWIAGRNVEGFGLREGRLTGRSATDYPILSVARTRDLGNADQLHAVEIRMRRPHRRPCPTPGRKERVMSSINSHAKVITEWEGLLEAGDRSPELQASIEGEVQSLRLSLTEVRGLKGRQNELKALGQAVTQQLKAALERGKEVAMRLRSVVKGRIGPKNELLVHFGVAPLRRRPRKPAQVKPSDGETPGTDPGASASPPAKPAV